MHVGLEFAALIATAALLAAALDYRTRKIPNWLTVPTALLGLAWHAFAPQGAGILTALVGFAVGFSLLLLPWLLGGGGMGDVKLLTALGAWFGPLYILAIFGVAAVLACVGAMGVMATSCAADGFSPTRKRFVNAGGSASAARAPRQAKRALPFAVPLAMATWLVLGWLLLRAGG
jgi:prepilin peptidase CpaA